MGVHSRVERVTMPRDDYIDASEPSRAAGEARRRNFLRYSSAARRRVAQHFPHARITASG
jgi:hypothetical protein